MGCIGDALEKEFKQLGQDIKDDIFDMGDALAAQFHKSLCIGDYKDFLAEEFKIGKIDDPGANPNLSREEREKTLFQYAQQQAFKEIKDNCVYVNKKTNFYYYICAERKDIEKLKIIEKK